MEDYMDDSEYLAKRRDRAIATILGFKEKECDNYLPQEVSTSLRKVILDQINDLCEVAFDAIERDVVYNEMFLERFDELLKQQRK